MSNIINLVADQGSSLTQTFTLKDVDGLAFNLTGFDARLQVRKTYGATAAEINATLANSKLALTNAVGGVLTWTISPSDTTGIRFNEKDDDSLELVFDLEVISAAGKVYKPARGTITLNREVTR
jgi:hypothetical protein